MQKRALGAYVSEGFIGRAIRDARRKIGISQAELGRRVGVSRGAVNFWEKGDTVPTRENALKVAKTLKLPISLFSGDPSYSNVAAVPDAANRRWIPRIDWASAGKGAAAVDPYPVGQGVDYLQISGEWSDSSFALTVKGDSMEPRFQEGDTIVVDPALEAHANDFVVVELLPEGTPEGQGNVTFKQYKPRNHSHNGNQVFDLIPLNPDESTITVNKTNPGRIIGVIVEHRQRLR